jgi:hypothetical protein
MAITTSKVSVGTAGATLADPTVDAQRLWVENLEPSNELGDFSRNGSVYVVSRYLTIANGGTALFSFTTGDTGAQFDFWNFSVEKSSVTAELIEGATITTTGTAIPAYNLNRNSSDTYEAVLEGATALTGGTVVLSEFIVASNQASGGVGSNKIVTLEPNTEYGFRFIDTGGSGPNLHIQIGWVEQYNGYNDVYLNSSFGESVRLRGGEKIQLELQQAEGLSGVALRDGVNVGILRQD